MGIHTRLSKKQIEDVCEKWGFTLKGSSETTNGKANTNYVVDVVDKDGKEKPAILTLIEDIGPNGVKKDEVPYLMDLLKYVNKQRVTDAEGRAISFSIMKPYENNDGNLHSTLDVGDGVEKPVVMMSFERGSPPTASERTPEICRQMGRALAAFHKASDGFEGDKKFPYAVEDWSKFIEEIKAANPREELSRSLGKISEKAGKIMEVWEEKTKDLPRGVAYGDSLGSNMLVDPAGGLDHVNLVDIYSAAPYVQLYDVGTWLNGTIDFKSDGDKEKMNAFLKGYDEVKPFSEKEIEALPFMAEATGVYLAIQVARAGVVNAPLTGKPITSVLPDRFIDNTEQWRDVDFSEFRKHEKTKELQ